MRAKDIQLVADVANEIITNHRTAPESAAFMEGVETVLGELAHRLTYSQIEADVGPLRAAIDSARQHANDRWH